MALPCINSCQCLESSFSGASPILPGVQNATVGCAVFGTGFLINGLGVGIGGRGAEGQGGRGEELGRGAEMQGSRGEELCKGAGGQGGRGEDSV